MYKLLINFVQLNNEIAKKLINYSFNLLQSNEEICGVNKLFLTHTNAQTIWDGELDDTQQGRLTLARKVSGTTASLAVCFGANPTTSKRFEEPRIKVEGKIEILLINIDQIERITENIDK